MGEGGAGNRKSPVVGVAGIDLECYGRLTNMRVSLLNRGCVFCKYYTPGLLLCLVSFGTPSFLPLASIHVPMTGLCLSLARSLLLEPAPFHIQWNVEPTTMVIFTTPRCQYFVS